MANLYQIKDELLKYVDKESGEIIDVDKFDDLQLEYNDKIESIALWIKNLSSDAAAYKAEKDAFAEREKQAKTKAESLKQYLSSSLNGRRFTTVDVDIAFRKSKSLDYDGEAEVPEQYLRYSDPTIDKTAITKAIKDGEVIEGFRLVENQNIQIK